VRCEAASGTATDPAISPAVGPATWGAGVTGSSLSAGSRPPGAPRSGPSNITTGLCSQALWPTRVRHLRPGPYSLRVDLVTTTVTVVLVLAALAVGAWSMVTGSSTITAGEVWAALGGRADAGTTRIVVQWRLPRVVFALLAGAALAIAGAIFQSITRNPLGSPDIIGFSTGAYTGALLVSVLGWTSVWATPTGALLGGLGTGAVVYLFARRVGRSGIRLVIVGIGVSVLLGAVNTYLLTVMRLEQAIAAASWGAGSLNDVGWVQVWPVLAALVLAAGLLALFARGMALLEMGDDAAQSIGINAERTRVVLLVAAVALVAVVTAAAGPIAFVALAAPQLAMRLCGASQVQAVPAAAVGALLLVGSDLVARAALAPLQLPVGIVTMCLGGAYLVWLLLGLGRRSRT